MKTKAAVLYEVGEPLVIEELELEGPRENEVLVKYVASGICHSDYSFRYGVLPTSVPSVLGHEGAGIIEEVGAGVTHLKPGDHVIASLTPACGKCVFCLESKPFLCVEMSAVIWEGSLLDGSKRFTNSKGEKVGQLVCVGTFSERAVIPAGMAVKVDDKAPLETICLIGCGVTTGVGGALNTVDMKEGDKCAVIGCGGVGLSILQGARIKGANPLIAVDPVAEKRELAMSLGATHTIDPFNENLKGRIKEITGKGVHFAFEALGSMKTIDDAYSILRPTGEAIIVGVPNLKEKYELPVYNLFAEKELRGSIYGSSRPKRDLPLFVDWYMNGDLKLDEMITKRIALEDVNQAFEEMGRGEGARTVIMFD